MITLTGGSEVKQLPVITLADLPGHLIHLQSVGMKVGSEQSKGFQRGVA